MYSKELVVGGEIRSPDDRVGVYSLNGDLISNIRFGDLQTLTVKPGVYIVKHKSKTIKLKFPVNLKESEDLYWY